MSMTLQQIDAKLKEADQYNTQLATRKQVYAEDIKQRFGASSTAELRKMLEEGEAALKEKEAEYQAALAEAERLLREAGVAC